MALPVLAQMAIMTALSLAAKKFAGKRPEPADYLSSSTLGDQVGSVAREQLRDTATLARDRHSQAVGDLRAGGVTGSGLTAGLAPVYQSNNRLYSGILASLAERQFAADASDLAYERQKGQFLLGRADQIWNNRALGAAGQLDTLGLAMSTAGTPTATSPFVNQGLNFADAGNTLNRWLDFDPMAYTNTANILKPTLLFNTL